ncbi:MAG: endopeptidase La [Armatimonadetes bacterium]|nr:endopeptidase La [Armatimonadota bacterium]
MAISPTSKVSSRAPALAIRDAVHFPGQVNTVHVVRETSLRAVRRAMSGERLLFVTLQRETGGEEPKPKDLEAFGVISEVLQALPMPDGGLRIVVRGLNRAKAAAVESKQGLLWADYTDLEEPLGEDSPEQEALMRLVTQSFQSLVELGANIPAETLTSVFQVSGGGRLADAVGHHLPVRSSAKQELLQTVDPFERLKKAYDLLKREEQVLLLGAGIKDRVEQTLGNSQREYYLREQLKVIQGELGGAYDDYTALQNAVESSAMPEEAAHRAKSELNRLARANAVPEALVHRNYLETLLAVPWGKFSEDKFDLAGASKILEANHYGLQDVKERILDFLAVQKLRDDRKGAALCLVGPPGVGKTTFAISVAESLGRSFVRVALGGVRDEAEIRGHRRTYVGAMPGRIVNALIQAESMNPVILLDEIDKLSNDLRGDPMSALLEALDPEQNDGFVDHYLDVPVDLSQVIFVATANVLYTLSPALRDRLEIIDFPGFSQHDRIQILERFLLPASLKDHGFKPDEIKFKPDAEEQLVAQYTRESGVRQLRRQLDAVIRRLARSKAEGKKVPATVSASDVVELLGPPVFVDPVIKKDGQVGVIKGLVVTDQGGDVIEIEVGTLPPSGPERRLRLTGYLGNVMRESGEAALTAVELREGAAILKDIHLHVPEGGIPKDGPSAGLAMALALYSALHEKPIPPNVAVTGEITLRGKVLAIGGLREKLFAAQRCGIKRVIIPSLNADELKKMPAEVLSELKLVPVDTFSEALKELFGA